MRSTLSNATSAGDVPRSDKRYAFAGPKRADEHATLCVFESAIDALSYLSILKLSGNDWRRANCISLSGVYQTRKDGGYKFPVALEQYLSTHPHIKKIVLCLDNDQAGRMATAAIGQGLSGYAVIDNTPKDAKDYNELLQRKKGITGKVKTRCGDAR